MEDKHSRSILEKNNQVTRYFDLEDIYIHTAVFIL